MIWIILISFLIIFIWYFVKKPLNYWAEKGVKQSNPWFIIGDSWPTLFKRKSFSEFIDWVYNMHPNSRYSGIYQFNIPTLVLRDPDLIKQIAIKDFDYFTDHYSFVDSDVDPLWGKILLFLKGQRWKEMRSTLSASFTSSKMKTMFHLMNEAGDTFIHYFLNKNDDLIELEMKDTYSRYTNDVIATTAFGIKVDSLTQPKNTFFMMGKKITNLSGILNTVKFFGFYLMPSIYKRLEVSILDKTACSFFRSIIKETIETREKEGIVRSDMINTMLNARNDVKQDNHDVIKDNNDTGFATVQESKDIVKHRQLKVLTNEDITSQALLFFFAGFETVSTAMCFGSYELAINKDVQDKLREEIRRVYKENDNKITYDALLKMEYMDMVVSEILRKWPQGGVLDRICTKPYTIEPVKPNESSLTLAVNQVLWIPVFGIHRDPTYYPDPEKFDPERFNNVNKTKIKPYTYIPFGVGPRNCIASRFALLEIKVLLFKMLLNFEISVSDKMHVPLRLSKGLYFSVEGGFWFNLKHVS